MHSFPTPEAIDRSRLRQILALQSARKPDLLRELLSLFTSSSEDRVASICRAIGTGDSQRAAREAHALRTSCFTSGAMVMAEACLAIEELAGQGGTESELNRVSVSLQREHARALKELKEILKGGPIDAIHSRR